MKHIALILFVITFHFSALTAQNIHGTHYGFGLSSGEIVTPPPDDVAIEYGAFVLASATYPTPAQRITRTKELHCTVFRYNFTHGDINRTDQIWDSGCEVAMTYNFADTQDSAAYPTDTVTYSTHLHSTLASSTHKPKWLFITNEPANYDYWQVDVNRFINILDAGIREGHKFGCLVGDGGATFDLVYMLFKYYQDNNLTDSLQWLKDASGITTINGPIAQAKIAFYTAEFAYIKTSAADFFNVHSYEPPRPGTDTFPTTTSKILPVMIDYLRSTLGKDVISNEVGSTNHSQALTYEELDEWKRKLSENTTCKLLCYYAGETPGQYAVDNSDYYAAWLLQ
jgi:hypothetical protein